MIEKVVGGRELKRYQQIKDRLLQFVMVAVLVGGLIMAAPQGDAIAYSVDYEMDQARVEKTIEHYGEPVRPIVEKAIKNNENNPNSKDTAENTYKRESPLNSILPEQIGETFSKEDLLEMSGTDNPNAD